MSANGQRGGPAHDILELFGKFLEELTELATEIARFFKHKNARPKAIRAEGKLDNMNNATKITYSELDVNGKVVPIVGRQITFASDNLAAATIDGTQQVINPDGTVSCPVVSLTAGAGGVANITGVDPATLGPDGKPLAAGDVDNVAPVVLPAVKATAVLS